MQLYASMSIVLLTLGAVAVYAILRFAAHAPAGRFEAQAAARRHGFWTALIAFFAVGTLDTPRFGVVNDSAQPGSGSVPMGWDSVWANEFWSLLFPMACLGAIYIIAQYTWPRPKGSVRSAELNIRRISTFLPRNLTVLAMVLTLAVGALIAAASTLDGVQPRPTEEGYVYAGRAPGDYFAVGTSLALLLLVAGAALAVVVIVRRRPVPGLDTADDETVRRIALNRLLRTLVLVLATLLVAVVNYGTTGLDRPERPDTTFWTSISDPLPLVILGLFVTMLFWAPPRLPTPEPRVTSADGTDPEREPVPSRNYRLALQVSLGCRLIGYILLAFTWLFIFFSPVSLATPGVAPAVAGIIAVAYCGFLIVIAVGEWMVGGWSPSVPSTAGPLAAVVPRVFASIAVGLLVLATIAGVVVFALTHDLSPSLMGAAAAVVLTGAATFVVIRRRDPIPLVDAELDRLLRKVSVHRVLRLATSAMFLLLATLIQGQSLLLSLQLGIYQPPSAGMAPELTMAHTVLVAASLGMALIPGPPRPRPEPARQPAGTAP